MLYLYHWSYVVKVTLDSFITWCSHTCNNLLAPMIQRCVLCADKPEFNPFTLKLPTWNPSQKIRCICIWNMRPILGGLLHHELISLQIMIDAKRQIIALERQDRVDENSGRKYFLHRSIWDYITHSTPRHIKYDLINIHLWGHTGP